MRADPDDATTPAPKYAVRTGAARAPKATTAVRVTAAVHPGKSHAVRGNATTQKPRNAASATARSGPVIAPRSAVGLVIATTPSSSGAAKMVRL